MTMDEFEAVRLIDLEGMTQEQCAVQMDVARTTAQAIYNSARKKLAECLVKGRELRIEGGYYTLCSSAGQRVLSDFKKRRAEDMRIAVTYENGQIFQHFGHTECFRIYDVEDGAIVHRKLLDTNGSGHGALAGFLLANQVEVLICGGIGGGARQALEGAGIRLYGGASGDADKAVEAFLAGELCFNPDTLCDHHGEHHGEQNGQHERACGGHCH